MTLLNDLDLVPGFTNRHTTILGPEMFDHAIFADAEIPLRTRIFLRLRNRLLFLLQIPGREHPTRLLFGLAGVNAGFFRRCRVASNVFFWRCSLVIVVKTRSFSPPSRSTKRPSAARTYSFTPFLPREKKVSCSFCTVTPEKIFRSAS